MKNLTRNTTVSTKKIFY